MAGDTLELMTELHLSTRVINKAEGVTGLHFSHEPVTAQETPYWASLGPNLRCVRKKEQT